MLPYPTLTLHIKPSATLKPLRLCIRHGIQDVTEKVILRCKTPFTHAFLAIYDNVWLVGEDKTLNPKNVNIPPQDPVLRMLSHVLTNIKYFIIIPALFGNGESSSPSNHATLKNFPRVSFYDNVRAQYELVTKHLDIKHLHAVLGWSSKSITIFRTWE